MLESRLSDCLGPTCNSITLTRRNCWNSIIEFVVVFVTDDQLLSPYQFEMSVRMYVICGVYVGRQIGPVWGLSYWSRLRRIFVWACATCP